MAIPAGLPVEFTADGMRHAINVAAEEAHVSVLNLTIESSEFPLLVGMICSEKDLERLLLHLPSDYEFRRLDAYSDYRVMGFVPDKYVPANSWEAARVRRGRRAKALLLEIGAPEQPFRGHSVREGL